VSGNELFLWVVQISAFATVFALWVAAVVLWALHRWRREQEIEQRLGIAAQTQEDRVLRLWQDGQVVETTVPGGVRRSLIDRLVQSGRDAGWKTPMPQALLLLASIMLVAELLLSIMIHEPGRAAMIVVVAPIVFFRRLQYCINKRTELFEKQLVDALDLAARSLRAGHPLSGAFWLIAQEVDAPIGEIFSQISQQESLGVSLQDSLSRAAQQVRSADMRIFATSVRIQLRSGGNLADMMERVAAVIRERMRLSRRVRVLAAEAQMSKWVLLALPLLMLAALTFINPKYMRPLYENFYGRMMLLAGAVLMLSGAWIMNRMARLKY
jgi:tight adherence protein B